MAYRCIYAEGEADPCGHLLVAVGLQPKVRHACPTCHWHCSEATARALCPQVADDVRDEDLPPLKLTRSGGVLLGEPADTRRELVGDPPDAPVPPGKGGTPLGVKPSARRQKEVERILNA